MKSHYSESRRVVVTSLHQLAATETERIKHLDVIGDLLVAVAPDVQAFVSVIIPQDAANQIGLSRTNGPFALRNPWTFGAVEIGNDQRRIATTTAWSSAIPVLTAKASRELAGAESVRGDFTFLREKIAVGREL